MAEISIALDPVARGRGLGTAAIRSASELVLNEGRVQTIVARIKIGNEGSLRAFRKAGYGESRSSAGESDMIEMARRIEG